MKKYISIFGKRYNCWTIFLGKGNILTTDISQMNPIRLPEGEFWADPFLFKNNNRFYIFFENYPFKTELGKISCGRIEGGKIIEVIDILDFDYHLSYPFVFEEEGEIYLMPESSQNKSLDIYRCVEFPEKWEPYSSAFQGEEVVDSTYFVDEFNDKWLFVNKRSSEQSTFESELFIYRIDSLELNSLEPHHQNPVIIDARVARNGGAIFKEEGKYYRPSQRNVDGVYGKGLNINLIEKLTIDEYKERTVRVFEPDFREGLVSMHHLHQIEGMFVFDAAYKKH